MRKLPDVELLRKFFSYNPETGELTRLALDDSFDFGIPPRVVKSYNLKWAGVVCKSLDKDGYVVVSINDHIYRGHRIAYAIYYGFDPFPLQIDHISGDKKDNRIENLRMCDNATNCRNVKRNNKNTSGETGVYWCKEKRRWRVMLQVNGRYKSFGRYVSFDQAVARRRSLALEYGYHPNHGRH